MDYANLAQLLLPGLKPVLESHGGASVYAAERSKLDSWLTVEIFRILKAAGEKPEPDREKMDVGFDAWGIAVRSVITNIPCPLAKDKKHSIKKGIESLVKDIWWLTNPGNSAFSHRAILFAAYPAEHDNERWQALHLRQVASELTRLEHEPFSFVDGVPGVLYLGLCTDT